MLLVLPLTVSEGRLISCVYKTISNMKITPTSAQSLSGNRRNNDDTLHYQAQTHSSPTKSPSKSDGNPFLTENEMSKVRLQPSE